MSKEGEKWDTRHKAWIFTNKQATVRNEGGVVWCEGCVRGVDPQESEGKRRQRVRHKPLLSLSLSHSISFFPRCLDVSGRTSRGEVSPAGSWPGQGHRWEQGRLHRRVPQHVLKVYPDGSVSPRHVYEFTFQDHQNDSFGSNFSSLDALEPRRSVRKTINLKVKKTAGNCVLILSWRKKNRLQKKNTAISKSCNCLCLLI